MKIKLLLAFIALSFVSCNDDNDPATTEVPEKKLEKIISTNYLPDGTVNTTSQSDFDDSNKLLLVTTFNPSGEQIAKSTYEYNESGLLYRMKSFDSGMMGPPDSPYATILYQYDSQGRISVLDATIVAIEADYTVTSYTYTNNVITASADYYDVLSDEHIITERAYHVNANGAIFKLTNDMGNAMVTVAYEGDNIVSKEMTSSSTGYVFNTALPIKGQYLNIAKNLFGGNTNNAIIANGFDAIQYGVSKYATGSTLTYSSTTVAQTFTYDFDQDGYPIKVSFFKDGATQPYMVKDIFYQ